MIERIFKLSELGQSFESTKKPLTDSDLNLVRDLETDNQQIIEYLSQKLKIQILKSSNDLTSQFNDNNFIVSPAILISLVKSNKFANSENLLQKTTERVLKENPDLLSCVLLIKSILKHRSDLNENFKQIIVDYLTNKIDPIQIALNSTRNSDFYLLSKYFRCSRIILSQNSSNCTQYFIKSTLNRLIESHSDLSRLSSTNMVTSNVLANLYELIVYLSIYSTSDLNETSLIELKSILVSSDGNFKPDVIYSGVSDDSQQIEFNLTCLECFLRSGVVSKNNQKQTNSAEFLFEFYLNPSLLFWKLTSSIGFDCEMIVEWLITSETKFLVYFLKYLKYLDAAIYCQNKNDGGGGGGGGLNSNLERVFMFERDKRDFVEFLTRVDAKLNSLKRSFPYNCSPLLKLLGNILK